MQLMHSATILLMELATESNHPGVLRCILEQANIEVLVLEKPPLSDYNPECVARICSERHPSLAILLLDHRTLDNGKLFGGIAASLPPDIPVIVAAEGFEATEIRAVLESGATDFITPPFSSASVLPRIWRLLSHNG